MKSSGFADGTSVVNNMYEYVPVESLKVGDYLMGIDDDPVEITKIYNGYDLCYQINVEGGVFFMASMYQPLYLIQRGEPVVISTIDAMRQQRTNFHVMTKDARKKVKSIQVVCFKRYSGFVLEGGKLCSLSSGIVIC